MLIELSYGETIEQLAVPADPDCQNAPGQSYCTAIRLIDYRLSFDAGTPYTDAVRRCVKGFDHDTSDLSDESFQRLVFEKIVNVLGRVLINFNGSVLHPA